VQRAADSTARRGPPAAPADLAGGTQAIERALLVLRVLASAGRWGMRVVDVVAASALPQATVSRIVGSLLREGVVERDARTRKLYIGHLVHELALVARARFPLPEATRQPMLWLAEHTEDTIYLSEPSGTEAVCTAREEGPYPIKALPLHVGIRRPLGVGAGGLAILSALTPARADEVLKVNEARYPAFGGIDVAWLRDAIRQTRRDGFSTIAEKATPGMTAIGAPIVGPAGEPIGAISIAAISQRMAGKRRAELARLLRAQCEAVAAAIPRA
jgi:DNA-binding IclR family transcriptional regulator